MSRQINVDNPEGLSDEDRQYLIDRGRTNVIDHMDYEARLRAASDAVTGGRKTDTGEGSKGDTVEVDEPYDKWKVEDLREELHARQLSQDGKKDELVARLEANDAENDAQ